LTIRCRRTDISTNGRVKITTVIWTQLSSLSSLPHHVWGLSITSVRRATPRGLRCLRKGAPCPAWETAMTSRARLTGAASTGRVLPYAAWSSPGGRPPRSPHGAKPRAFRVGAVSSLQASAPCTIRCPGSMIKVVIHISPRRARIYPPTLVSSNAPKARSDSFCAWVKPRMPVIFSRS
jgi:hypothetical protein